MSLWGSGPGQLGDRAPRKPPRVLHQPTALNNQEITLANNANKVRDVGEITQWWGDQYYYQLGGRLWRERGFCCFKNRPTPSIKIKHR